MSGGQQLIIVGVDGSASSSAALAWAVGQAAQTGARLEVIMCWRQPASYGYPADFSDADFEKDATVRLDALLEQVLGATPVVPVESRVVEGHPAPVLVAAAQSADLLVVGSRGHGTLAGMLVGSTSLYCVNHATCPVVVVHEPA